MLIMKVTLFTFITLCFQTEEMAMSGQELYLAIHPKLYGTVTWAMMIFLRFIIQNQDSFRIVIVHHLKLLMVKITPRKIRTIKN